MTCIICASADDPERTYLVVEFPLKDFVLRKAAFCSTCLDVIMIANTTREK